MKRQYENLVVNGNHMFKISPMIWEIIQWLYVMSCKEN